MRFCGLFVLLLLGAGNAAAEVRAVDGDSLVAEGRRVRLLVCCRSSLYLSDGSHYSGGRNTDLDSRQLYGLRYCNKDSRYTLYHFCIYHPFSSVVWHSDLEIGRASCRERV